MVEERTLPHHLSKFTRYIRLGVGSCRLPSQDTILATMTQSVFYDEFGNLREVPCPNTCYQTNAKIHFIADCNHQEKSPNRKHNRMHLKLLKENKRAASSLQHEVDWSHWGWKQSHTGRSQPAHG
jgi:hypothetical protein